MALDPRIALAIKSPQVDASGLISGIYKGIARKDMLDQRNVENARTARLDQLNVEQNVKNNARIEAQDKRQLEQDKIANTRNLKLNTLTDQSIEENKKSSQLNDLNIAKSFANEVLTQGKSFLDKGDFDGYVNNFANKKEDLLKLGVDVSSEIKNIEDGIVEASRTGNTDKLKDLNDSLLAVTGKGKKVKSVETENYTTKDGKRLIEKNTIFEDGGLQTEYFDKSTNEKVDITSDELKLALDEKQQDTKVQKEKEIEVEKQKIKTAYKTEFEKVSGNKAAVAADERVTKAMISSKSAYDLPIIRKNLDTLATGGGQAFLDNVLSFVGVDTVDKTNRKEVARKLGLRIITQLKPMFGGSFSVSEGEWLAKVEGAIENSSPKELQAVIDQIINEGINDITNGYNDARGNAKDEILNNIGMTDSQMQDILKNKGKNRRGAAFKKIQEENRKIEEIAIKRINGQQDQNGVQLTDRQKRIAALRAGS